MSSSSMASDCYGSDMGRWKRPGSDRKPTSISAKDRAKAAALFVRCGIACALLAILATGGIAYALAHPRADEPLSPNLVAFACCSFLSCLISFVIAYRHRARP